MHIAWDHPYCHGTNLLYTAHAMHVIVVIVLSPLILQSQGKDSLPTIPQQCKAYLSPQLNRPSMIIGVQHQSKVILAAASLWLACTVMIGLHFYGCLEIL